MRKRGKKKGTEREKIIEERERVEEKRIEKERVVEKIQEVDIFPGPKYLSLNVQSNYERIGTNTNAMV